MGLLEAIGDGKSDILSSLIDFTTLSDVIRELVAALGKVEAHETRIAQLEGSYGERLEKLERDLGSVRTSQDLLRTTVDETRRGVREVNVAWEEKMHAVEKRVELLEKQVTSLGGGSTTVSMTSSSSSSAMTADQLQPIVQSIERLDESVAHFEAWRVSAGLDDVGRRLSEVETLANLNQATLPNKADKIAFDELVADVGRKAAQKTVDSQVEMLDIQMRQVRHDLAGMKTEVDGCLTAVHSKADLVQLDEKADRNDVAEKASKASVVGIEQKTIQLKNEAHLTTSMLTNLRTIVDRLQSEANEERDLVGRFAARIDEKADQAYVNELDGQAKKKLKNHDRVIKEVCRTKADVNDMAALESQVMALLNGEDAYVAAGKLHFRCLSCDRLTHSITGPSTEHFRASATPRPESTAQFVSVPRTEEVPVYGSDGNVYHGRQVTPGQPRFDMAVQQIPRPPGDAKPTPRPHTSHGVHAGKGGGAGGGGTPLWMP